MSVRIARAINRMLGVRGKLWRARYEARALTTPAEMRAALVDVLMNAKKHGARLSGVDPFSSALWFDGIAGAAPSSSGSPTAAAKTSLASVGWRKLGLLRKGERPAEAASGIFDE